MVPSPSTGLLYLALLTALLTGVAQATVPPTSVDAGVLQKRFTQPPAPLATGNTPTPPPLEESPQSVEEQAALAKLKFTLGRVQLEGNSIYAESQLKPLYARQLGKQISLLDAQRIAKRITEHYRSNGYVLSQAVLPPQEIANNVLVVRVVEGFISNVRLQGDIKNDNNRITAYAKHIESQKPVQMATIERYMLIINDLPGVTATSVIQPSPKVPGGAELVITVTQKQLEGSYGLDNRGSKYVGPLQHTINLVAQSVLGLYERTTARLVSSSPSKELRLFNLTYEHPLDSEGTRLTLDGSYSHTNPGDALKTSEIFGDSYFLQAKISHPFVRSRQENVTVRATMDFRNTLTNIFRTQNLSADRLRTLRFGGSYDFTDASMGANLVDAQISRGLNVLNASSKSDLISNTKADGTFTKINLDVSRTQALPNNFSLLTSASGQYSLNPLLASEQFSVGGSSFGSAYDPAAVSGDHGIAGRIELRYSAAANLPILDFYQLYGNYDIGRVWVRKGAAGANDKQSLASVAAGIRTVFSEHISGDFQMAKPLTKPVANQGNHEKAPRFFLNLTARF